MAWLTGWAYRKSITLVRASGAVTNHQMKLLVGESSGSSGEAVDCGGKCLSTFNDLRFTTSDGSTILDYWIESITGTTPNQLATIWIEFDSIGTSDTTFYMYYGKADATSVSNGANTFIFFDDFNRDDNATVGNSWTEVNNIWTINSNTLLGQPTSNPGGNENIITHAVSFPTTFMIETRSKRNTATQISYGFSVRASGNVRKYSFVLNNTTSFSYLDSSSPYWHAAGTASADTYYILGAKIDTSVNQGCYYVDRVTTIAENKGCYGTPATLTTLAFDGYWFSGTPAGTTDWVLVRNFLATDPSWGSWGSEESGGISCKQMVSNALKTSSPKLIMVNGIWKSISSGKIFVNGAWKALN